jgi:hypothetical protein
MVHFTFYFVKGKCLILQAFGMHTECQLVFRLDHCWHDIRLDVRQKLCSGQTIHNSDHTTSEEKTDFILTVMNTNYNPLSLKCRCDT